MAKNTLNDRDRGQWIDNDEGLYRWWKVTGEPKAKFIKENREELDKCINNVLNGNKPAHYRIYGG